MIIDEPFRGPRVIWNKDDIKRIVDRYGFERACTEIAGNMFEREYVCETVRFLLGTEKKLIEYQSFFSEREL